MNQTTTQMTNERSSDFESSNLNKRPDNSDFSSSDQPPPYSSLPNEQPYFSEASIASERDGSFSPNPISIKSDRVENPSTVVDLTTPHTLENSSR